MSKLVKDIQTNPKPMFYACVLEGLRKIALKCGYALAVHGTCASDLDLIAVRWSDNYESPTYLMEQFVQELTQPELRYKNQMHYAIPIIGDWYVDLTVIDSGALIDYEEMENRFCLILEHATLSAMSRSNYDLETMKSVIDDAQQRHYYGVVKSDLEQIIKDGGTMEDVKDYIKSLA